MGNNTPFFLRQILQTNCCFLDSSIWKKPEVEASFAFVNFDYPVTHIHRDFCEICVVYSGEVMNFVNGYGYLMRAGDCCLLHKDDQHMLRFTEKGKDNYVTVNYVIHYSYYERLKYAFGEKVAGIFEGSERPKAFHIDDATCNNLYRATLQLQTANNEYFAENELACKNIILQLLQEYAQQRLYQRKKETVPEWIQNLLIEVQKPENSHKRTSDFLENVGYSYSHIAKEFKKYMGCSFVQHLTMVKLQYAKELLLHTRMPILEISLKLGFSSLSHFNHIFRQTYGCSPSTIRKC